jgi:SnoaL-like domain
MAEIALEEQAESLLTAYCAAVDGHHLDQLRALFTDDGTFFTRGTLMTPPERDAFFSELWASSNDRSTHVCREVRATRVGDKVMISALLTATFIQADGSVRLAFGHYDDLAEMTAAGLRLKAKRVIVDRTEVVTAERVATPA